MDVAVAFEAAAHSLAASRAGEGEDYFAELFRGANQAQHARLARSQTPPRPAPAPPLLEVEHAVATARSELRALDQRRSCFWARADQLVSAAQARQLSLAHTAKLRRAHLEARCTQALAACLAEQRRCQSLHRGQHGQLCDSLRRQHELCSTDLRWRVFCERLAHESSLTVQPLAPHQLRQCEAHLRASTGTQPPSLTVVRAVVVGSTGAPVADGSLSARSGGRGLSGLVCGDVCRARSQLDAALEAMRAAVAPPSVHTPRRPGSPSPLSRGASSARASEAGSSGTCLTQGAGGAAAPAGASPAMRRLPLFPLSMLLSAHCLTWLHSTQPVPTDTRLFFLREEFDECAGAARVVNEFVRRGGCRELSAETQISAVRDADDQISVAIEGDLAKAVGRCELHLEPASCEHLLAVDLVARSLGVAEHRTLCDVYAPRFPHPTRLATLWAPVCGGPGESDDTSLTELSFRPLRRAELQELASVYVLRAAGALRASLVLPVQPPSVEATNNVDKGEEEQVELAHAYCWLRPPAEGKARGNGVAQHIIMQAQPHLAGASSVAPATPPHSPRLRPTQHQDEEGAPSSATQQPALVRMLHDGSLTGRLHQEVNRVLARRVAPQGQLMPLGMMPPQPQVQLEKLLEQAQQMLADNRALTESLRLKVRSIAVG